MKNIVAALIMLLAIPTMAQAAECKKKCPTTDHFGQTAPSEAPSCTTRHMKNTATPRCSIPQ